MRHIFRSVRTPLLAAVFLSATLIAGCAARASYRVYDPDHDDYHRWDNHETSFYLQWEGESHREHRDFDKREKDEQKDYWNWRHKHSDKDQDKH